MQRASQRWLCRFFLVICGGLSPFTLLSAAEQPPDPAPSAPQAPTNSAWTILSAQVPALILTVDALDDSGRPRVEASTKHMIRNFLTRLERALEEHNAASAVQDCDSILANTSSVGFRKEVTDLSASIAAQAHCEQATLMNQANALLAVLPTACAKAKTTEELQACYERVQQMENELNRLSLRSVHASSDLLRNKLTSALQGIHEWMGILDAHSAGDEITTLELLNRLQNNGLPREWSTVPEVVTRVERLQSTVNTQIEIVVTHVCDGLSHATSVSDVQALTTDFNRQYERFRRVTYNAPMQAALEEMRRLLNVWSQVIPAEEKGDFASFLQAYSILENDYSFLSASVRLQSVMAVKRNALLQRLIILVDAQVTAADTLEKLLKLRAQLLPAQNTPSFRSNIYMPMHANPYGQSEIASFLADLQTLESMQAALQAKQYGEFMHGVLPGGENTPHRWRKIVLRHMNALLRTAFREMYGLSGMDIAEGQTVADAVLAAADHAAANKQWELLGRCLDAYRTAAYGAQPPPALLQEQINACRNFVAASNYERVGDLDRAVAGYLAVLQAPAERSPVEAAVAALERLHKEHPDIFERTRNVPVGATPAAVPVAPTPLPQPASPPTGAAHGNGISVTDQSTGPAS